MDLANITFDADDPRRLAAFWSEATGRTLAQSEPYVAMLNPDDTGAGMLFLKVPEGKTAKARFSTPQTFPRRYQAVKKPPLWGSGRLFGSRRKIASSRSSGE